MVRKLLASAVALAMLTLGSASVANAQFRSDKAVYFTFSQPVALPGVTLPAGKYLFRLMDSQVTRTIVQVFNDDGTRLQATFMTIPSIRLDRPEEAEIRFVETTTTGPSAIRSWWYPGDSRGWEFIYPRAQALQLAKGSKEPVLTTVEDTTVDKMSDAPLARVGSTGDQAAVDATAAPAPVNPSGTAVRGSMQTAQATTPATQPAPAAPVAAPSTPTPSPRPDPMPARDRDRDALPQTASSLPVVFIVGLLSLAGALVLRRSRVS